MTTGRGPGLLWRHPYAGACAALFAALLPLAAPWGSRWDDVCLYAGWGHRLLEGATPWRDFPVEYPPMALVPLLVPIAWAHWGLPFHIAFVLWAYLSDLWLRLTLLPQGRHRMAAQWLYTALQLPLYAVFYKRIDLFAAACATAALVDLIRGPRLYRPWLWLAAGTLIKVYPVVFLVPMAVYGRQRGMTVAQVLGRMSLCLAAIGVGMVVPLWLVGAPSLDWLHYHADRGVQATSSYVAWHLLSTGLGAPLAHRFAYGAFEVTGTWAAQVPRWASVWMVLGQGVTVLFGASRARGAPGLWRITLGLLVALITTAKVFSPQYVVWLLPVGLNAAFCGKRRDVPLMILLMAIACTTAQLYPGETLLLAGQIKRQAMLVARLLLLAGLWLYLMWRPSGPPSRALTLREPGLQANRPGPSL